MNEQNKEKKRKYLADKRHAEVMPMINCLECEHCQYRRQLDAATTGVWWCGHPDAESLRGRALLESVGPESMDFINAPAQCPLRMGVVWRKT